MSYLSPLCYKDNDVSILDDPRSGLKAHLGSLRKRRISAFLCPQGEGAMPPWPLSTGTTQGLFLPQDVQVERKQMQIQSSNREASRS